MPIRHSSIHQIDKKPDGSPAVLHLSHTELLESQATENLLNDLNVANNAKTGSPAMWQITEQGEDALKATRLNSPQ